MHKWKLTKFTFHFRFAESRIGNQERKFQLKQESCLPFPRFGISKIENRENKETQFPIFDVSKIGNRQRDLQFYLK